MILTWFIQLTSSLYRVLVLFIKKKNSSLHSYILTSEHSTTSHVRIDIHSLWYLIFLTCFERHIFILRSTSAIYITWHGLWKMMNGKQLSRLTINLLNGQLYLSVWLMSLQLSNGSWMIFFWTSSTFAVIYLNDIFIYSDNISQYKDYIKEVLYQLQKARLYAKVEKYKFYSDFIKYLEYILSSSSLSISSNKIKIIQN